MKGTNMAQLVDVEYDQNGDPFFRKVHVEEREPNKPLMETVKWLKSSPIGSFKSEDGQKWSEIRAHYRRAIEEQAKTEKEKSHV